MIKKEYQSAGHECRVTFRIAAGKGVHEAAVLGDFNEWNPGSDRFTRRDDGSFAATVVLPAGRDYRFRYLLDGKTWMTDEGADATVPNRFGELDGLLRLPLSVGNGDERSAASIVEEPAERPRKTAKKRASDPMARLAAVAEEAKAPEPRKRKVPAKPKAAGEAAPEPIRRTKKK